MDEVSRLRWQISLFTAHLTDAENEVDRLRGLLKGARKELQHELTRRRNADS